MQKFCDVEKLAMKNLCDEKKRKKILLIKTQIVIKNYLNFDKNQKLKKGQTSTIPFLTKLKNPNCENTQKLTL